MKIQLPNGCSVSKLSVNPTNWKSKSAKTNVDWYISYRFYHPDYAKPKQVIVRRMNGFSILEDRQKETLKILETELQQLKNGFNPFAGKVEVLPDDKGVPFYEILKNAFEVVSVAERTRRDLKFFLNQCDKKIKELGFAKLNNTELSRKHIKALLENISSTNDRFNKNRSYMMILLAESCEREIISTNFARDIKKKKTLKKARIVLTLEERKLVNEHLDNNYNEFHRFLHIFYHSGSRISELLKIHAKDVDIENGRFKVIIQKGRNYKEVYKPIKNIVLAYWKELMELSTPTDVIFSKGLTPGKEEIQPYQINKRWYRLVKKCKLPLF